MDPDQLFINLQLSFDPSQGTAATPATLQVQRPSAVLNRMQDFYFTVMRLQFPAATIPVSAAMLKVGSDYSENLTIHSFAISYREITIECPVFWISSTDLYGPKTGIVTTCLQLEPYYLAYDFDVIMQMWSEALLPGFQLIQANYPDEFDSVPAPYFFWDKTVNKPVLVVPPQCLDSAQYPLAIYFNAEMAALFNGFPLYQESNNNEDGADIKFRVKEVGSPLINGMYYIYPFNYTPTYMCPCSSLQVVTDIPLVYEAIQQQNYSFGQVGLTVPPQSSDINPSQSIATDFQLDFANPTNFLTSFIYNKTEDVRFATVAGQGRLTNFSLSLNWVSVDNRVVPLYLLPLCNATIKLMFIRKELLKRS